MVAFLSFLLVVSSNKNEVLDWSQVGKYLSGITLASFLSRVSCSRSDIVLGFTLSVVVLSLSSFLLKRNIGPLAWHVIVNSTVH